MLSYSPVMLSMACMPTVLSQILSEVYIHMYYALWKYVTDFPPFRSSYSVIGRRRQDLVFACAREINWNPRPSVGQESWRNRPTWPIVDNSRMVLILRIRGDYWYGAEARYGVPISKHRDLPYAREPFWLDSPRLFTLGIVHTWQRQNTQTILLSSYMIFFFIHQSRYSPLVLFDELVGSVRLGVFFCWLLGSVWPNQTMLDLGVSSIYPWTAVFTDLRNCCYCILGVRKNGGMLLLDE